MYNVTCTDFSKMIKYFAKIFYYEKRYLFFLSLIIIIIKQIKKK